VLGGFLVQTGFLQLAYFFLFKEQYPLRIWQGEDINVDRAVAEAAAAAAPRPPPGAAAAAAGHRGGAAPAAANAWRHTFLGGRIAPGGAANQENDNDPNPNNNNTTTLGLILTTISDIGFFIGSFFLSIFPMWRPEALEGPRLVPAAAGAAGNPADPIGGGADDPDDDDYGLPQVRPPRDPVEAADDDDDDEDDRPQR